MFPPDVSRCGIYVCEFSDGSEYVGQGLHFFDRIASHRRRWPGEIVAVRFSSVPVEELDQVEKDTIAQREAAGVGLRNNALVGLPLRSEALDAVIDHHTQEAWLAGDSDTDIPSNRADAARARRGERGLATRLAARDDYPDIVQALAYYVAVCLVRADLTEQRFWSVSNMPSTNRSRDHHRLAAISINNVEAFIIMESRDDDGKWGTHAFLNTALDTQVPDWAAEFSDMNEYRSTGWVRVFWFEPLLGVTDLLFDDGIRLGARRLATGLLRKGSGMMARFHDSNLADDIFIQIDDWLADAALPQVEISRHSGESCRVLPLMGQGIEAAKRWRQWIKPNRLTTISPM
jgi:hypothetical protein